MSDRPLLLLLPLHKHLLGPPSRTACWRLGCRGTDREGDDLLLPPLGRPLLAGDAIGGQHAVALGLAGHQVLQPLLGLLCTKHTAPLSCQQLPEEQLPRHSGDGCNS